MAETKTANGQSVGILGAGAWGTTLAEVIARHGGKPILWVRDRALCDEIRERRTNTKYVGEARLSPAIEPTDDLAEVARRAPLLLVAVPTRAMREVARHLGDHVRGDQMLVSCAKGIEAGTYLRMSEILREETCVKKVGCLSGPNLAGEIIRGQPAASVVASRFREVIEETTRSVMGTQLRVYGSEDIVGVEIAGALKNIIALAVGIASGLGFGDNSKATLITRGLAEIARYGAKRNANPLTFSGLAGVGDLVATCASPLSRNHQVGFRLGKGEKLQEILASMVHVAEGVNTAPAICAHARELGIEMPIAEGVCHILGGRETPIEVLKGFMARPPVRE